MISLKSAKSWGGNLRLEPMALTGIVFNYISVCIKLPKFLSP